MDKKQLYDALLKVMNWVGEKAWWIVIGVLLVLILFFILKAIGIFEMTKKLNVNHGKLAFVPVASEYIFGKTAECYRKNNGKKSAKLGLILLIFKIVKVIAIAIFTVVFAMFVLTVGLYASEAIENDTQMTREMFALATPACISFIVALASSICYTVTFYICLWRIISIYDHSNATVFTLISIICRFVGSVFIFILRNHQPKVSFDDRLGISFETGNE